MFKLFSRVILSVLLLLAQQGAMLHELSHLAASPTQQDSDEGQHAIGGLCSACLAFSQVGISTLPELRPLDLLAGLAFQAALDIAAAGHTRELPTQRSRGPPTFL